MANRNFESLQRARKARYLMRCVDALGIPYREVAKELGVGTRRVKQMHKSTPQLHVLHALGLLVEQRARMSEGLDAQV